MASPRLASSEGHDVLTLAYGKAGSGISAASGRVLLIGVAFVGVASGRNALCAQSSTCACDTPCLT